MQFFLLLLAGAAQAVPVFAIADEHLAARFKVQRDALTDRALVGLILGRADFHRPVERQIAVVDLLQNLHRALKAVVAFEHLAAENLARDLDLLRQRDFLLAGEQGDFAHLREIHPHRIVDPLGRSLGQLGLEVHVDFFFVFLNLGDVFRGRFIFRNRRFLHLGLGALGEVADVRLVDELNAHLVDHHQQRIQLVRRNDFVRQLFVQFFIREITARSAKAQDGLDAQVHLFL